MVNGLWMAIDRINDPGEFIAYAAAADAYLQKCGAKTFIQDSHTDVKEGKPGHLTALTECPTVEAANAADEAPQYQEMIRLRAPNSEACFMHPGRRRQACPLSFSLNQHRERRKSTTDRPRSFHPAC